VKDPVRWWEDVSEYEQLNLECLAGEAVSQRRNLKVTKWMGTVPAVAVCTACAREFKVPLCQLSRASEAQESLRIQFAEHKCPSQDENEAPSETR